MKKYYVYQFYNINGDIIYVGRTKRSINQRMKEHFGPHGHLSKDILNNVQCIKYYEFLTEKDMELAEAYLIKKYNKLQNSKKERISRNDIEYIENKLLKKEIQHYRGTEIWHQYSIQQKQKTTIITQVFLKLKNTLKGLTLKT